MVKTSSLITTRAPTAARFLLWLAAVLCAAGCGTSSMEEFERFEQLAMTEKLVTVPLGSYVVPVPITLQTQDNTRPRPWQVELEFELHAAVLPRYETPLRNNFKRLEGRLRDRVIQVCRQTPVDDLLDPGFTTLKSHLFDSLQPYFGEAVVQHLHVAEAQVKRL